MEVLENLTVEQLEAALQEKKKAEKAEKLKAKQQYESIRDSLVSELVIEASALNATMSTFKKTALRLINDFRDKAHEYGDIRKNSKGGFSLRNSKTGEMVSLDRNTVPEYDERSTMAEQLIKDFLEDKVKKKDLQSYRLVMTLLEKNKRGDLTPSRVASLLKIKDNYDDHRWIKAMELFEESFNFRDISYSVSFFTKDEMGKDRAIVLTFSSIPVISSNEQNTSENETGEQN